MSNDGAGPEPGTPGRLDRLEQRVARLEAAAGPERAAAAGATDGDEVFWALRGLQDRVGAPGAVLFTGSVTLPGGGQVEWQDGRLAGDLLDGDWGQSAAALAALAHPVRLRLLHAILAGTGTAAGLAGLDGLGTTGQLYHHLRQLVAAGWLRSSGRGQYAVPPQRVVPLLVTLAAAGG